MKRSLTILAAAGAIVLGCDGGNTAGPVAGGNPSPVGTFTLATVNGDAVPMLWDEIELWQDAWLRSYWTGGSIQFRADSTYTVEYQHRLTGPNLPGTVQQDTFAGTWRLAAGGEIELHRNGGGVQYWQTANQIHSVIHTATVPALDGGDEQVTFVFVRN